MTLLMVRQPLDGKTTSNENVTDFVTDINECVDGMTTCNENHIDFIVDINECIDTVTLLMRMTLIFVTDINECIDGVTTCNENGTCSTTPVAVYPNSTCVNTDGSYRFVCDEGFMGNGVLCVGKIARFQKLIYFSNTR